MKLHELVAKKAALDDKRKSILAKMQPLVDKDDKDFTAEDQKAFDKRKSELDEVKAEIKGVDEAIERKKAHDEELAATAQPVVGQDGAKTVAAAPETDPYVKEKSLIVGGVAKMIGVGGGNIYNARIAAKDLYGENHPVTKSLVTAVGSAGGFIVPPDVMGDVVPLLRAAAVVRGAGPRVIPMPRGTMTMPGQTSAATASYGSERTSATKSQQKVGSSVATFKKLKALVPVSNDMMRYANPAVDAFVRDDLVRVMALREDLAFILGDGTQDTPKGYLTFANAWVRANGGTIGVWNTGANSTLAVNGSDPANSTGGNFISSTASYTLSTVAQELGGAVNRLDTANVPENKRMWFMNPRSYNYLYNVQNSLGVYVYRDELNKGTLLGYPVKKTTQIGTNYYNADGSHKDCSFVFLVEMTEDMIFDSMSLELAVSRDSTYVDENSVTQSVFANDETLIRAIAEHDHLMRHDQSVAVIQAVRWAPAIS